MDLDCLAIKVSQKKIQNPSIFFSDATKLNISQEAVGMIGGTPHYD
jgi:hypothetical protein